MLAVAGGILIAVAVLALIPIVSFCLWFFWKLCKMQSAAYDMKQAAKKKQRINHHPDPLY